MKRALLTILAVLTLAAAFGLAKTTTWTAAANTDFADGNNWSAGVAVDGDTVDCSTNTMPATNRLAAGTLHFNITNGLFVTIDSFVNGASLGSVTVAHADAIVVLLGGLAVTGNIAITTGTFYNQGGTVDGTVTVTSGAYSGEASHTVTGAITLNAAGRLCWDADSVTITSTGGVILAGGTIGGGVGGTYTNSVLDCAVVITGSGGINWTSGELDIYGGINGTAITHTNVASGNLLLADVTGTLNLGSATASTDNLAITVNGSSTQTLGANLRCGALTLTTGTLAGGTYTIQNTGFSLNGATFTGSGAMTVNGNLTYSSGNNSHTGAWTQGTGTLTWNTSNQRIASYVVGTGATVTLGGSCLVTKISGGSGATIAGGSNLFYVFAGAANAYDCTATWTGTGATIAYAAVDVAFAGPLDVGPRELWIVGSANDKTVTVNQRVTCASLRIYKDADGKYSALVANGGLTTGAITLGSASGTGRYGKLTLGAVESQSGNIARAGAGTSELTTAAGCRVRCNGTITGTGITVTVGNGTKIMRRGGVKPTVTAVTATGSELVVAGGINGGSNTNVRFTGPPSVARLGP